MNVCAIIVTRGDVPLQPVLDSLPPEWEIIVMDNANGLYWANDPFLGQRSPNERIGVPNLSVYGRYWAIEHATADLIYVQDDDVIVSDPQAIVDAWLWGANFRDGVREPPERTTEFSDHPAGREVLVANMPLEFRHDGYTDSCLVGFGACFHRDLPERAFRRVFPFMIGPGGSDADWEMFTGFDDDGEVLFEIPSIEWFHRTCDVIFTTLTPRVLVDVPKVNREFAEDANRMYRTPGHVEERQRMLDLARQVRDAK